MRQVGSVAELHALDPFATGAPGGPQVWWCDPTDSAIVLGSRQSSDLVDVAACERAGVSIVGRRSGGGAVLVRAGEMIWIDLVLPHGVAPDDVRRSMVWAGERWIEALGPVPDTSVHRGAMVRDEWSSLVCFAGVGPGEVVAGGRKLVGLSQRRTRYGIRIQGMVHRAVPDPAPLFGGAAPERPLTVPAVLPEADPAALAAALAAAITVATAVPITVPITGSTG